MALPAAGYAIKTLVVRGKRAGNSHVDLLARKIKARVIALGAEPLATHVIWITVPDDAIAPVARSLAGSQDWKGKFIFHSSGALTSDELAPLRAKGARVASVHPMMTFVRGKAPEMQEVAFAVEGDAAAVRMARAIVADLGGNPFLIRKQNKVLYHVFGSFASPMVIALMASLEQVGRAAGLRQAEVKRVMTPLLMQTLRNHLDRDAASAFSGPLVRGDVATVCKHLDELERLPEAKAVYLALSRAALKLLPVKNRAALERQLRGR